MDKMVMCHDENDIIIRTQSKGEVQYSDYTNEDMYEFFSMLFLNTTKSTIFWVQDLRLYAESIIDTLNFMGWQDLSECDPKIKDMPNRSYKYLIEIKGNAFYIISKNNDKTIHIYNSDNLLANISNQEIIHDFGKRKDNFLKDLVDASFNAISRLNGFQSHKTPFTISMLAMREWKRIEDLRECDNLIDCREYKAPNGIDDLSHYLRDAYSGGWNYINNDIEEKVYRNQSGTVYDVNSLYPFIMATKPIPWGQPNLFQGPEIPYKDDDKYYYYVRVNVTFDLKEGKHFPYIRRKGDFRYRIMDYLKTSDIITIAADGTERKSNKIIDINGNLQDVKLELTLSKTDYELMHRHYDVHSEEILDGVYFRTARFVFKHFVDSYYNMKLNAKKNDSFGQCRIAKMILNGLCGTLAKRDERSNIIYELNNNRYDIKPVISKNTSPSYIHMAAAILSYAREYTYEAACANYDHFLYSDTDSLHVFGEGYNPIGIEIDNNKLGCWKIEKTFKDACYMKRKYYIMETNSDADPFKITMAGVSYGCKELIEDALNRHTPLDILKKAREGGYYDASDIFKRVMRILCDADGEMTSEREVYGAMATKYLEFAKECREYSPCDILKYVKYPTSMTYCANFTITHKLDWKYVRDY